jgi:hypothetical protein
MKIPLFDETDHWATDYDCRWIQQLGWSVLYL